MFHQNFLTLWSPSSNRVFVAIAVYSLSLLFSLSATPPLYQLSYKVITKNNHVYTASVVTRLRTLFILCFCVCLLIFQVASTLANLSLFKTRDSSLVVSRIAHEAAWYSAMSSAVKRIA